MARTRRRVKQYRNIKTLNKRTKRIKKQRRRSQRRRTQRTQRSRSSKNLRGGVKLYPTELKSNQNYILIDKNKTPETGSVELNEPLTFITRKFIEQQMSDDWYKYFFKNSKGDEVTYDFYNEEKIFEDAVVPDLSVASPVTENLQQLKKVNLLNLHPRTFKTAQNISVIF